MTTGTPVALGAAISLGADQLIAYAPDDGYTYVAWNSTQGGIDLCIVPGGATGCEDGGPQLLTDPIYGSDDEPQLAGYHYTVAARADFLRRLGRTAEARAAYEEALLFTQNGAEQDFLATRLRELDGS